MKLGYCSITWGGVVGDPVGVTSVKDLFYRANGDALQAIAEIGEVGYQGTEMFDGNVADFAERPDELKNSSPGWARACQRLHGRQLHLRGHSA